MNIVFLVFAIGLVLIAGELVYCLHAVPRRKAQNFGYSLLFLIALSAIAVSYDYSGTNYDIVRHSATIESLRSQDISLAEYLFSDKFYNTSDFLITHKFILYLIAKLGLAGNSLSLLSTVVFYSVFLYILNDYFRMESIEFKFVLPSVLLCFCMMPFIFVISGIRNATAVALSGLGIYKKFYKRDGWGQFLILFFLAGTIHPASLFALPAAILSCFYLGPWLFVGVFLASLSIGILSTFLSEMSIPLISSLASSYQYYSGDTQYSSALFFLIADLVVLFILIISLLLQNKTLMQRDGNSFRIFNFLFLYVATILGQFGNYDLVLRPAYLLGLFSPLAINVLRIGCLHQRTSQISRFSILIVSLVSLFVTARYLVSFLLNLYL